MEGPQPRHQQSAGGGVYVAEEKNPGAELAPAEGFFIPIKFSGRAAQPRKKICNPKKEKCISLFSEGIGFADAALMGVYWFRRGSRRTG